MNKYNPQNAMIELAIQEDVALNLALKGLMDIDALLSNSQEKPSTINKKWSFIQFFRQVILLFGIFYNQLFQTLK